MLRNKAADQVSAFRRQTDANYTPVGAVGFAGYESLTLEAIDDTGQISGGDEQPAAQADEAETFVLPRQLHQDVKLRQRDDTVFFHVFAQLSRNDVVTLHQAKPDAYRQVKIFGVGIVQLLAV